MKIIAIISDGQRHMNQTVLIEASGVELAHLLGCAHHDDDAIAKAGGKRPVYQNEYPKFSVGDKLNPTPLFETMVDLKNSKAEIARMAQKLRSVVGSLEKLPEVFEAVGNPKPKAPATPPPVV